MAGTFAQKNSIKYEQAVVHVHSTYNTDNYRFTYTKKQTGYYIQGLEKLDTIFSQQLWSNKKKKFLPLNLESKDPYYKKTKTEITDLKTTEHDRYYFDLFQNYNYYGWKEVELKRLLNKKRYTEDDLYAIGKIYSLKSQEVINTNQSFSDKSFTKLPESGQNLIPKNRLTLYLKYARESIKFHKNLHKVNPEYGTFIGTIKNKYEDQYMSIFREVATYQNESEARTFLVDSLYNKLTINYAKNILKSCSKNAVLFTHGDNDTHPLLYVQAHYKFRDDVRVINMSLLNTNNYINHIRDVDFLQSKRLNLTLNRNTYSNESLSYVYPRKDKQYKQITSFNKITALWNTDSLRHPSAEKSFVIPYQELKLKYKNEDSITFLPREQNVLYRSDIIFLDLINSNETDFYMTSNPVSNVLKEHFKEIGLVHKFSTEELTTEFRDNLLTHYHYSYTKPSNTWTNKYPNLETRIAMTLRHSFVKLATTQFNENKIEDSQKSILAYFDHFQLKDFPLTSIDMFIVYKLQAIKEYKMAETCLTNILESPKTPEFYTNMHSYHTNGLIKYISSYLKSYTLTNRLNDVVEEAKKIQKTNP